MYIYDIIAVILIGISHVLFYFQLIRYNRLSFTMVIVVGTIFIILLGTVVSVTGYPVFNIIMFLLFLLSLGLMQPKLTFMQNLYFTLASLVSITLMNTILVKLGMILFMWSPLNLYLWTTSIINLIVASVIFIIVWIVRKPIQRFAHYIVESRLYYISFVLFIVGLIGLLILTTLSPDVLVVLHQEYEEIGYIIAFILFFILLLFVLIGSHLSKEKLIEEQQSLLDKELLDYVDKLEVMHDELASFRHDYINVLFTLDEGVRTRDIKQIEEIYYKVITPTSKLINNRELDLVKLSQVNILEVKSLLSVKLIDAQQRGIQVMIDIPKPVEKIAMPMIDFIRIISILVDNAIEATINTEAKVFQLAFFEVKENQYFIVRNSSEQKMVDLEEIYEKSYSSKEGNLGYGLHSLKRMVDKATNVTLETSLKDSLFTQTIIIKK